MKTSEVLRKAKELIGTPEKWWQYRPGTDRGAERAFCVSNACSAARGGNGHSLKANELVARIATGSDSLGKLFAWNDHPDRKHSDVMLVMSKAIELAEADEERESLSHLTDQQRRTALATERALRTSPAHTGPG